MKNIELLAQHFAKAVKQVSDKADAHLGVHTEVMNQEKAAFDFEAAKEKNGFDNYRAQKASQRATEKAKLVEKGIRMKLNIQVDDEVAEANYQSLSDLKSALDALDSSNATLINNYYTAGDKAVDEVRAHFGTTFTGIDEASDVDSYGGVTPYAIQFSPEVVTAANDFVAARDAYYALPASDRAGSPEYAALIAANTAVQNLTGMTGSAVAAYMGL